MYLQSRCFGLLKLKITGDTFEKVLYKPNSFNTEEMRLALADGKLYLRNLTSPTHNSDNEETGVIRVACDTLEEIPFDPDESESENNSTEDNDDDNSEDGDEEEEDNDDEEGNSDNYGRENEDDEEDRDDDGDEDEEEGSDEE